MSEIRDLIRPNILKLKPYSSARDEFSGDNVVLLDANENPYGELNRYPDPYQKKLKERLSEIKEVSKERLFLGNGSDEIIDLLFRIFCTPGKDSALTFTPGYGMYKVSADINDVEIIEVGLDHGFRIDIEKTRRQIEKYNPKIIFLSSPNNPTANIIPEENIQYFLKSFGGILVIDEAYIDFCPENSWLKKAQAYPRLVILQTLSKAWSLASLRIGLAVANPEIIHYLNKVKPPYNISSLNQKKALDVLENEKTFKVNIERILSERLRLNEALDELHIVNKIYPSDANFLLVEFNDANYIYEKLKENRLIVRNRSSQIESCLRITVGTEMENTSLIEELKKIDS